MVELRYTRVGIQSTTVNGTSSIAICGICGPAQLAANNDSQIQVFDKSPDPYYSRQVTSDHLYPSIQLSGKGGFLEKLEASIPLTAATATALKY